MSSSLLLYVQLIASPATSWITHRHLLAWIAYQQRCVLILTSKNYFNVDRHYCIVGMQAKCANNIKKTSNPPSLDSPNTNSTELTGSEKKKVLSREFLHNSVLVNSRAIDRVGKTQDWENRDFDDLTISEKIRFYAKKEVKKARKGVDGKEIFKIEELRRLGKNYLDGLKGKKIVLVGEKKDIDKTTKKCCVFLEYNSLLHRNYVKRLLAKFHKLDNRSGVGIDLTLRCVNHRSIYRDLEKIKKCWNRLRLELRRRYWFWDGNYFLVTEVGEENQMVHLHVILYGLYYVKHKWLMSVWHKITKDSYIVWCSKPHQPKKATGYISKYLGKSLREGGLSVNGILAIWASGFRLWSCSRDLFNWLSDFIHVLEPGWEWEIYLTDCDLTGYYEIEKTDYG